ncbi:unnamed protein product [Camellia sinensis]
MAVNGTLETLQVHRLPLFKSIDSSPSRKPFIAASTFSGSLHVLLADSVDVLNESEVSVSGKTLHVGSISCIDVQENGSECVSVGEDGRVNLVSVGNSNLSHRRFFDSNGWCRIQRRSGRR